MMISALLALVLSACSGTRQLGPTYFIDADTTDYIEDDRDFPQLGKYDDMPPVVSKPSNVLDIVKALPETVRSLGKDQKVEEAAAESLIPSDMPVAKPNTQPENAEDPDVPANDIAKSLIGDLSSNMYTDPVFPSGGLASASSDDRAPRQLEFVEMEDRLRFAPQLVEPKPLAAPKAFSRNAALSVGSDLEDLRRSVYLRKLTESSGAVALKPPPLQFASSSVRGLANVAVKTVPVIGATAAFAQEADDQDFTVLARMTADGLVLSAAGGRKALVASLPIPKTPVRSGSSPDPKRLVGPDVVALLAGVYSTLSSTGFAAR